MRRVPMQREITSYKWVHPGRGAVDSHANGHQMRELGSIDVMRLDQTLGQSRHYQAVCQ
jgi:hypothetical protein